MPLEFLAWKSRPLDFSKNNCYSNSNQRKNSNYYYNNDNNNDSNNNNNNNNSNNNNKSNNNINKNNNFPETRKYWVDVQWGKSHLMERRTLFSLGWQSF